MHLCSGGITMSTTQNNGKCWLCSISLDATGLISSVFRHVLCSADNADKFPAFSFLPSYFPKSRPCNFLI